MDLWLNPWLHSYYADVCSMWFESKSAMTSLIVACGWLISVCARCSIFLRKRAYASVMAILNALRLMAVLTAFGKVCLLMMLVEVSARAGHDGFNKKIRCQLYVGPGAQHPRLACISQAAASETRGFLITRRRL